MKCLLVFVVQMIKARLALKTGVDFSLAGYGKAEPRIQVCGGCRQVSLPCRLQENQHGQCMQQVYDHRPAIAACMPNPFH
jgi:hypothetical protein